MDKILVRSAVVRILFVALLALVALAATAHAAPAATGALHVSSAVFTPARTDDGIAWRAHWILTPESAAEVEGGATRTLRFALPLAESARLEPTFGVAPLLEDGHVTGVVVDRAGLDGRLVSAVVHQRIARGERGHVPLAAPVAAGTSLQIIDGDLGAGTRFEVDTGRGLERRVGHTAPPSVGHAAREEARRLTGYASRVTGAAVYVRGDDVKAANGLTAAIVTPQSRSRHGTLAVAVAFAAIVGALFVAVRRLRGAASVERADALLAAELDALDPKVR